MKNPSLSPHSIIQPFTPQNMQELASHLISAACIVHLTPHSIHHPPWAIYAHARTMGCAICALHTHVCNPCPLRLCCSPRPSLHPPHTPAFAPQSTRSHSPSIPSHTCSWAHMPCRVQIHTPCPRACPFMCAPTNVQGPRYALCTRTSPFPHAHAVQHPMRGHARQASGGACYPPHQGSSSDRYPCS